MKKIFTLMVLGMGLFISSFAQDQKKDESAPVKKAKFTKSTFQSSNVINMQSVEMVAKGNLQFMISHHFGTIWTDGISEGQNLAQFLGLNSGIAHTYLSFDYSVTNHANIGLAMTGNSKFEGWVKFKLLRQQTGIRNIPVTVTWLSLANADAAQSQDTLNKLGWNKFSYLHQLLIARKFSKKFSLQLSPTFIHYNVVPYGINNDNNIFSLGFGAKYQLADNKAITLEYSRQFNMFENVIGKTGIISNYSPDLLSVGIEFNTGGHVFQFFLSNTTAATMIEQLTRNNNSVRFKEFAMGFRLNRSFFIAGGKK